jgi:predicted  nucleic acid-binding Zn-ribbon protein
MFLRPTHRSDLPDWQGKVDYLGKIIPKKIQETLQGGKLKDVEGKLTDVDQKLENELKEVHGTLTDVEGKLTDVEGKLTDVEQKLEKELKEVHGTLTDIQSLLADTFRTDTGSSRFRTNDATSAEDMVDDLEWDIPVLE